MARTPFVSRAALALALAAGGVMLAVAPPALAKKEEAAKITFSPAFAKAAADLDKTLAGASSNAAVTAASQKAQAATTPAAQQAAAAEVDAALGGAKAKLDAAAAVASTPGDKLKVGEMTQIVAGLEGDAATQHRGLVMMLDSGALPTEQAAKVAFYAGATAYQSKDYPTAARYLKQAKDGGFHDPSNQLDPLLADSYKRSGNTAAVMELANQDLAAARAAGTKPSETSIRTALQAAYDAKNVAAATDLSAELVRDYPTTESWVSAIGVVRQLSALPAQDNLDLMRLMSRTGSLKEKRDYLEYIEDADPRRLPGESLKAIDAGIAAGKLTASETAEYRQISSGRIAADKASLAGLERDARSGGAKVITTMAAADAFLSYGQPAQAEELYKLALTKPGVDKDRALTRLGIAQSDQGKYADAKTTFAQVSGPRGPTAKLWSAYADTKSGAGAAQASAAPAT